MKYGYLANAQQEVLLTPFYNGLLGGSDGSNIVQGKFNVNLGDVVQGFGVKALYRYMGIPDKDIIPVERNSLAIYSGEDVVVPMNFYFTLGSSPCFPPSPNVIPVFWGYAKDSAYNYLNNPISDYRDYYKMFEPVGCRDHATCTALQSMGVDAYVSGCASLFLPKRAEPFGDKVFIVDIQKKCMDRLPQNIRDEAVYLTNNYLISTDGDMAEESFRATNHVQNQMQRYALEARLVITSRLHVAIPCAAMGIPVVFFYYEYPDPGDWHRFTWLSEILPVFSSDDIPSIDWTNPPPPLVDIEAKKKELMDKAAAAVERAVQKHQTGEFAALRPKILNSTLVSYKKYVNSSIAHARNTITSIRERDVQIDAELIATRARLAEVEAALLQKNEDAQAEIESLLNSKSWRLTAPLRKLRAIFKRKS